MCNERIQKEIFFEKQNKNLYSWIWSEALHGFLPYTHTHTCIVVWIYLYMHIHTHTIPLCCLWLSVFSLSRCSHDLVPLLYGFPRTFLVTSALIQKVFITERYATLSRFFALISQSMIKARVGVSKMRGFQWGLVWCILVIDIPILLYHRRLGS